MWQNTILTKYIPTSNMKLFSFKDLFVLFFGLSAVTLQLFLLPFHVWDAGIARSWYMINGLIPYKDFVWIRMPLDLFIMEAWFKAFGSTGIAYQFFIYFLLITLSVLIFITGKVVLKRFYFLPFIFFNIFLFPLFQNTEEGEILVGIFNVLLFLLIVIFFQKKNMKYLFAAGLISGISFVTKQNSVLVIGSVFLSLILDSIINKEKIRFFLKKIALYSAGIIIPVLFIFLYFYLNKGLSDFLNYTFFFILGTYSKAQVNQGNGLLIVFAYISLLIPFAFLIKKTGWKIQSGLFLVLQIIALFPSLLPSFLSYRAFTAFPLISIVTGALIGIILGKTKSITKIIVAFAFLIFIIFNWTFIDSYIGSIKDGEVRLGQYITSYADRELEIAGLIKKNSAKDEKIISYGSEMIYVLSDRLPANKYVDPFPYLLYPYDETTKVFTDNPPKLVVYDESLPNDHIGLDKWPFIDFLHKNYDIVKQFDDSIFLYKYRSK